MSKQKKVTVRITKLHPRFYVIHEHTRFLFFFHVWVKGSPTLGLARAYAKFGIARTAIHTKARQLGYTPTIVIGVAEKKR